MTTARPEASDTRATRNARFKLVTAVLLCAPTILGTSALWSLVTFPPISEAHSETRIRALLETLAPWLFVMATYGPLLLIVAIPVVLHIRRAAPRSRSTVITLAILVLAVIAAVTFYQDLMWTVQLP